MTDVVYSIDKNSPRLKYEAKTLGKEECKRRNVHKGQIKLLLSEIDFLNDFAQAGDHVVYAGAADGRHIPALDGMFHDLQLSWHLFDPAKFSMNVIRWSHLVGDRGKMYNKCFESSDALAFKSTGNPRILFICDMRTSKGCNSIPEDEQVVSTCQLSCLKLYSSNHDSVWRQVMQNQECQMKWVLAMNPTACCLKFRGAFDYNGASKRHETFENLDGELRIQAWHGRNSTEVSTVVCHN